MLLKNLLEIEHRFRKTYQRQNKGSKFEDYDDDEDIFDNLETEVCDGIQNYIGLV